jgi:hypothetical protein
MLGCVYSVYFILKNHVKDDHLNFNGTLSSFFLRNRKYKCLPAEDISNLVIHYTKITPSEVACWNFNQSILPLG